MAAPGAVQKAWMRDAGRRFKTSEEWCPVKALHGIGQGMGSGASINAGRNAGPLLERACKGRRFGKPQLA